MFYVRCLAERGDFVEASVRGSEAVHIAETNGRARNLVHAYLAVGFAKLREGDVLASYHPLWLAYLSEAHLLAVQTDEAHEHAQRALQLSLK
jgi:hypothetical protein